MLTKLYRCSKCGNQGFTTDCGNTCTFHCHGCEEKKEFVAVPLPEYTVSDLVTVLENELENQNFHGMNEFIGDAFSLCSDPKTVLLMVNCVLKGIGSPTLKEETN